MKTYYILSNTLNINIYQFINQIIYNNLNNNFEDKDKFYKQLQSFLKQNDPKLNKIFENSYGINFIYDYYEDDLNLLHLSVLKDDIFLMYFLMDFNLFITKYRTFTENTPFLMFVCENGTEQYMTELLKILTPHKELLKELILEVNMYNENIFDYLQNNDLEYDFLNLKYVLMSFLQELEENNKN